MDQQDQNVVEGEDVAVGHHSIDKLLGNGISTGDIKKLEEAGYHTVEQVAMATKKDLITVKGISDGKADKLLTLAMRIVPMGMLQLSVCNLSTKS